MQVVTSLSELRQARAALPGPLGFVPTMGYLHEGHLSLVRAARAGCASVAASIFVNPTQFGPTEDLDKYPRDLERDLRLLEAAGVDLVWTPTRDEMYPANFQTWVTVDAITTRLEGEIRPGHFRGVTTVVAKLFNGVQPQRAYFGQKDAQQALVIRRMVQDLAFPVEIIVCPIVREPDGLAMSSRNVYLNPAERQAARVLSRALNAAREAYLAGERDAEQLRRIALAIFVAEPLARVQYVSLADAQTLQELEQVSGPALLSTAAYIGKTRLIDNLLLG
ncbi:MAG TPA: pantoate--beta-alanine ligase [Anaerolineaceae bacterium]